MVTNFLEKCFEIEIQIYFPPFLVKLKNQTVFSSSKCFSGLNIFCSTQCMSVWSKPSWNIFFFLPNWALMEIRRACRIIDVKEDTKWVFLLTQTDYISCVFTVSHAKRHKTVSLKANIRWNKIAMVENSTKTSLADDANDVSSCWSHYIALKVTYCSLWMWLNGVYLDFYTTLAGQWIDWICLDRPIHSHWGAFSFLVHHQCLCFVYKNASYNAHLWQFLYQKHFYI